MKRFDIRHLHYFVAVAEEKSFSRAATLLHVSQPSISAQLRRLEALLGFALFERTSRSVELTPQAEQIYQEARKLIDASEQFQQLVQRVRRQNDEKVRVGVAPFTSLLVDRTRFTDAAITYLPTLEIELVSLHTRLLDTLLAAEIDFAIFLGRLDEQHPGLQSIIFAHSEYGFLVPEDHAMARQAAFKASDMQGLPVAIFGKEFTPRLHDQLVERLTALGARIVYPPESHPFALAHYALEKGIVTVANAWFNRGEREPPGFVFRSLPGARMYSEMQLVRERDRPMSPGAQAMWDWAVDYTRASRQEGSISTCG